MSVSKSRFSGWSGLSVAAVVLAVAVPAAAQFKNAEEAVEYRQSAFTVMGQHFGRIGAMVQGKVPYDAKAAADNAAIVQVMSHLPYQGFVEGTSGTKKGSPKPNIWTNRADFDSRAKKLQDNTAKLAAVAKEGSMDTLKPAFVAVADTCKGCHDEYRNK